MLFKIIFSCDRLTAVCQQVVLRPKLSTGAAKSIGVLSLPELSTGPVIPMATALSGHGRLSVCLSDCALQHYCNIARTRT